MAGVFACLYVIRIGGAAVLFLGGRSFPLSSPVTGYAYAYDMGEWSFLQGTQAYQLSITHKSAPRAWEGDMRKCSLPIPFYSAV